MNTKYKVQLTKDELNKFNFLQESYKVFESTKLKMMSVYQYMIKHSADSIDGLIKSFSDFWKMYKRHHKGIKSKSSFISIIYKLEAEGFIFIEKLGKVNIYHARKKFLNQDLKEELKENLKHENNPKSIDTTKVDDDDQDTQILNNKNNYINIINNTSNDVSQNDYKNSLAYKKACEVNSKNIVAPVELMKIAYKILKEIRICTHIFPCCANQDSLTILATSSSNVDIYAHILVFIIVQKRTQSYRRII